MPPSLEWQCKWPDHPDNCFLLFFHLYPAIPIKVDWNHPVKITTDPLSKPGTIQAFRYRSKPNQPLLGKGKSSYHTSPSSMFFFKPYSKHVFPVRDLWKETSWKGETTLTTTWSCSTWFLSVASEMLGLDIFRDPKCIFTNQPLLLGKGSPKPTLEKGQLQILLPEKCIVLCFWLQGVLVFLGWNEKKRMPVGPTEIHLGFVILILLK